MELKNDVDNARKEFNRLKANKSPSGKAYLSINRNPIFLIYFVEKEKHNDDIKYLVAFSMGIPTLTNEETKYKEYQVNKIYQNSDYLELKIMMKMEMRNNV